MSKYDDCHRVDNRYTTAIGMSVWRAGRDLVLLATNVPIT